MWCDSHVTFATPDWLKDGTMVHSSCYFRFVYKGRVICVCEGKKVKQYKITKTSATKTKSVNKQRGAGKTE